MRGIWILVTMMAVGCSGTSDDPAQQAAPAPSPPPPPPPPAPAQPTPTQRWCSTIINIVNDTLSMCTESCADHEYHLERTVHREDARTTIMQMGTCREQFPDRIAWGTCRGVPREGRDPNDLYLYRFRDVYGTDGNMADCLEMGGQWSAQPRGTLEWEIAQTEDEQARLEERIRARRRR